MKFKLKGALLLLVLLAAAGGFEPVQAKLSPEEIASRKELIHEALLDIYMRRHNVSEATTQFKALQSLGRADAKLHFKFGLFLAQNKNYSGAIPYMVKAAESDPNNAMYAGELGNIYLRTNEHQKAMQYLRRAASLPDGRKYQKNMQQAKAHIEYEQQRQAIIKRQEEYKKHQVEQKKREEQRAEEDW